MSAPEGFRRAMEQAGLTPPDHLEADGRLHRYRNPEDKPGSRNSWYVLHNDPAAGAFGCWKRGISETWSGNGGNLSDEEWERVNHQIEEARAKREQEQLEAREKATRRAAEIWEKAEPAPADHPYLEAKKVQPHGLRQSKSLLLVPVRDVGGRLQSLQFIKPEGEKRFLKGGEIRGGLYFIGEPEKDRPLVVCEGYATAATIHETTGLPVVVGFNAQNLRPVAEFLKDAYPEAELIIAADDDRTTEGNPGVTAAHKAADAVGCRVVVPEFSEDSKGSDLNDLAAEAGPEAVREAFEAAHYTSQNKHATMQPAVSSPPKLAYDRRILDRFADALRLQGVVGECATAQTVYLALTSRLLKKPVSLGVKGNSSSGKSHIVGKVVEFFPPEAVVLMTGVSERALVYEKEEYSHRSIIMYEAEGLREGNDENHTAYFFRSLLSEGRLDYRVTVRSSEGGFTTKCITKEGPTNIIFTTTRTRVHYENETRVLSLTTDDSADQTARVLQQLADESEEAPDLEEWRELQVWLQKANNRVTIPFARRLAELVPPAAVRLRRDFASVLELIRAHAVLHQATRETDNEGRIVATLEDYEAVRVLVSDVISAGVGATVSRVVMETVAAVEELASDKGVTARTIGQYLRLDKSTASRRLRMAADDDYIRNLEERRGRPGRWVLGSPLPEEIRILPDKEELVGCAVAEGCDPVATVESLATSAIQAGGCTVAGASGGEGVEIEGAADREPPQSGPAIVEEGSSLPPPECDRI